MVINNLIAGLSGILVPLTLDRLKVDPAVSSAVFVTMMTDIMGFSSSLGLANLVGFPGWIPSLSPGDHPLPPARNRPAGTAPTSTLPRASGLHAPPAVGGTVCFAAPTPVNL